MQQVLLKKLLMVSNVESKDWEDYITDEPGVTRELYGLFEVGAVSIQEVPIGWRFFDSLKELNEALDTSYQIKDVKDFDETFKKKKADREKWLKDIWYYD